MSGTRFSIEVQPRIPPVLDRLPELARNLVYTWDRELRRLFRLVDNSLYERCAGNLSLFLRRVSQAGLDRAAEDATFIESYRRVVSAYDAYHARKLPADLRSHIDPAMDLVAYFCFEFGFHESLPLYSGGLGILAADHCKAASDLAIPIVAVGLLYQQGYFEQLLDGQGHQIEHYSTTLPQDLPFDIARDAAGAELRIPVPIGRETLMLRVWRGRAGHTQLVLLDSEISENSEPLRSVTHRLYGGDEHTRIQQEIVLGIGGVRALRALGLEPTVWHLNEGHAAFQVVERCREQMAEGLAFDAALELVASATVFTTHTPVAAGHDVFPSTLVEQYLGPYFAEAGLSLAEVLDLGNNTEVSRVNMTSLAIRGSRHHNGVSRIHGAVASSNEAYIWPQVPPELNPMGYVTNGVHLQTFLARDWVNLFDVQFSDWRGHLADPDYWVCIDEIPDHQFWSVRKELMGQLFVDLKRRLWRQERRAGVAESTVRRLTRSLDSPDGDVLVLGFARRFATYKRATLLFSDRDRLARLLNDPDRRVIIVLAGKAHPHDEPGKQLIRQIHEVTRLPEFEGKVLLVENYDLALARRLVAGVDVWINTPEYPLEASGTSGMKAGMNGVVNLSVLDGWWAEAFDGTNGWGIVPHDASQPLEFRTQQEARDLLEIVEHEVIPRFFDDGTPADWIATAKASMRTIIPRFNTERMVREYVERLYGPAATHARALAKDHGADACTLAVWKRRVAEAWPGVSLSHDDLPPQQMTSGESARIAVSAELNGLSPEDVRIECIVSPEPAAGAEEECVYRFAVARFDKAAGRACFELELTPPFAGLQTYRIRLHPYSSLLAHPFETGHMLWL